MENKVRQGIKSVRVPAHTHHNLATAVNSTHLQGPGIHSKAALAPALTGEAIVKVKCCSWRTHCLVPKMGISPTLFELEMHVRRGEPGERMRLGVGSLWPPAAFITDLCPPVPAGSGH